MNTNTPLLNRQFSVAPMLDCTDRHARYLLRLISKHAVLYTEMITTGALLHADTARFLDFSPAEHPVALQLGGSDPDAMRRCAELAQQWGYDEVNINVGCPSDRVQSGSFGACLMQDPKLVARNVQQMQAAVDIPVTIKCRIGVDEQEPREALWTLVEQCADAGCSVFLVHARKAWLKGLSPKQNRDVPPLDYPLVYQLKQDFPDLHITLNGGVESMQQCTAHLAHLDGVMMGRMAYSNPYILAGVDQQLYGETTPVASRDTVLQGYLSYVQDQLDQGVRLSTLAKPVVGLFHGEPRSRLWRRHISEHAHLAGADATVLYHAYQKMLGTLAA